MRDRYFEFLETEMRSPKGQTKKADREMIKGTRAERKLKQA